jgi:hypothetical protein
MWRLQEIKPAILITPLTCGSLRKIIHAYSRHPMKIELRFYFGGSRQLDTSNVDARAATAIG